MTRSCHPASTRAQALELLARGASLSAVGRELRVARGTIGRWRLQARAEGAEARAAGDQQEHALTPKLTAVLPSGLRLEAEDPGDLAALLAGLGFDRA
jgi:transposase-like protein